MTLPIFTFVALVVYYRYFYGVGIYNSPGTRKQESSTVSCCKNPDCVRCQRYRYVQESAKRKLSWILRDLESRDPTTFSALNKRVPNAILRSGNHGKEYGKSTSYYRGNGNSMQATFLQDPTILMVLDLPSKEIVTGWHQDACKYLKQRQTRAIVSEALYFLGDGKICDEIDDPKQSHHTSSSSPIVSSDDSKWTVNDSSPQGDWRVFQILNQGVWNPILLRDGCSNKEEPCRKLLELIQNIPGLLNNCLFGNAFISKIYPGTSIEPHCGPTNIRHRLQFLLKLPHVHPSAGERDADQKPKLSLSVGHENSIFWNMENDTFVFDDSFVHSVTYPDEEPGTDGRITGIENSGKGNLPKKDSLARMVLIVDLWHPGLQDVEMKLLRDLYPPYTTSRT